MNTTTVSDTTRTVTIPACEEHQGFHSRRVTLEWVCPVCGGPRGEPVSGISYDGSRRLGVDMWENPCGHVDKYSALRREADAGAATNACPIPHDHDFRRAARDRWETDGILEIPLNSEVRMDDARPDAGGWVQIEAWIDSADAAAVAARDAARPYIEPQPLVPAVRSLLDVLALLLPVLPAEWDRVAELVGWQQKLTAATDVPAFLRPYLPTTNGQPFIANAHAQQAQGEN